MTTIEITGENLNQFFERVKGYIDARIEEALTERDAEATDSEQITSVPESEINPIKPVFDSKAFARQLTKDYVP